jgi:dihydroorotate dehydrogenase electron transfer subunit
VKKKIETFTVKANERLNDEYFELVLHSPVPLPDIAAGQFAQVRVEGSEKTYLRRPISFYDVNRAVQEVHLLIQEVGAGTRHLGRLAAGDLLNMVYPLGHPFSLFEGERFLLVAGGVGIAPMLLLGRQLRAAGKEPVFVFGFRSAAQLIDLSRYVDLGPLYITTEDGSV